MDYEYENHHEIYENSLGLEEEIEYEDSCCYHDDQVITTFSMKDEKRIVKTIRIDITQYNIIKKLSEKFDTSTSATIKLLSFGYLKDYLKNKSKDPLYVKNRKVMIYLKNEEKEFMENIAKKHNETIAPLIRSILDIAFKDKNIEKRIEFLLILDNYNFDFRKIDFIENLFKIYKETNLRPFQILEKLIMEQNNQNLINKLIK